MDTELTITDWSGQTIGVGDTVIYAPGERYRSGMGYFKVLSIKSVLRNIRHYKPNGSYVEVVSRMQLRLRPLNYKGSDRTITEGVNPYAFNSLTKFTAEGYDGDE